MSQIIPFMPPKLDPFAEFLAGLDPSQADALLQMQEIHNNQVALSSAIFSLQRHAFLDGQKIRALEKITETNQ